MSAFNMSADCADFRSIQARPDDETTFIPDFPGENFDRGSCRRQAWITADGEFTPEPNRYHLFLNYGCGWSHQCLLVMYMRKLEQSIGVTHVGCYRGTHIAARGDPNYPGYMIGESADSSGNNFSCKREVYNAAAYMGVGGNELYGVDQLTIPVLFDKHSKKVVSNDPAHILMMLDYWADSGLTGADKVTSTPRLYPVDSRLAIEKINDVCYPKVNNGVYCCWFADATDGASFTPRWHNVKSGLEFIEEHLSKSSSGFLVETSQDRPGPSLADARAFPHLFRFDCIYHKLMLREMGPRISTEFPCIQRWLKRMLEIKEVFASCDLAVATRFYFSSFRTEVADAMYKAERDRIAKESGGTVEFPTLEDWGEKRQREELREDWVRVPDWKFAAL